MSKKAERGTKRTCQNSECGSRFYDLNRDPVVCPICETVFKVVAPPVSEAPAPVEKDRRPKKPEFVADEAAAPEEVPVAEGEDVVVEEGAAEPIAAEGEETFLEEEEDGADVSNILGGPVAEDGEEP